MSNLQIGQFSWVRINGPRTIAARRETLYVARPLHDGGDGDGSHDFNG